MRFGWPPKGWLPPMFCGNRHPSKSASPRRYRLSRFRQAQAGGKGAGIDHQLPWNHQLGRCPEGEAQSILRPDRDETRATLALPEAVCP